MSSNKKARQMLEETFGKGCMFKRGRIAQKIEARGGKKHTENF